jgi:hypothetical protein
LPVVEARLPASRISFKTVSGTGSDLYLRMDLWPAIESIMMIGYLFYITKIAIPGSSPNDKYPVLTVLEIVEKYQQYYNYLINRLVCRFISNFK